MRLAGLYVASLLLSTFGAWAISKHADKVGLVDCPNGRSSHCMPTPKGGAIGIFLYLGGLLYLLWVGFRTVFIVETANYYNIMDGIKRHCRHHGSFRLCASGRLCESD